MHIYLREITERQLRHYVSDDLDTMSGIIDKALHEYFANHPKAVLVPASKMGTPTMSTKVEEPLEHGEEREPYEQ